MNKSIKFYYKKIPDLREDLKTMMNNTWAYFYKMGVK